VLADARGATRFEGLAHPGPTTTLVGPIGPHRRYAWACSTIEVAQRIRRAHGGTINDVVLTAITGGFRRLFTAHAEDPGQHPLRSLVPVSVRGEDEQGVPNNRVAALLADLPVHLDDPLDRLAEIRRQLKDRKNSHMAEASDALVQLGDLTPASLLSVGLRVGFAGAHLLGRTSVHTVTTNVPGPRQPLYAVGRRMLTATPYVPIASPIRVGVAIFSYQGLLTFGITGDQSNVADVDVLAHGIEADLENLVALSPEPGEG
jgi:diacylglycerol O-acyltransferase